MTKLKDGSLLFEPWFIPILYIFGRIIFYLGMVSNGLYGFGDVQRYYDVAALPGLPFFTYWVEYPPVFPFLCTLIYHLVEGQQLAFEATVYLMLTLAGAAALFVFLKIEQLVFPSQTQTLRTWVYLSFLLVLSYTWWYFEMIPVALLLLGIWCILKEKPAQSGWVIGVGILTKWFSGLLLPAVWRLKPRKIAIQITLVSLGLTMIIYGFLWGMSPVMTQASLMSQPTRNSWETIWAWIDQNNIKGAIANPTDLTQPGFLSQFRVGNPPVIPATPKLIIFLLLGLFFWINTKRNDAISFLGLVGITWATFLLWSQGWSPQWILYLIPLIFLTFPIQRAVLWNFLLVMLSLLEWPTLIGHDLFIFMGPLALMRSFFFVFLIIRWYRNNISTDAAPAHQTIIENVVE
jgi:hypothetical protein